ncbi:MAG: hypothetical protein DI569_12895 [Sphingopyxis macrogoltabida]|uniref:Uncharacterized protein n=1 Tax=Sphingopyxis macrogoltabida TaxID=33050 RepID=A0A2W5KVW8_SPHMC|nr:MAG: hypothetical protein DI569_12895 [Sphingopyxis macrogoltabida]
MSFIAFLLASAITFVLFVVFFSRLGPPPPPAYQLTAPPMTSAARKVLPFMGVTNARPARSIAQSTQIPVSGVLAAQRELRALGLAKYGPAVNDNGKVAGSGYSLTPKGVEVQRVFGSRAA